MNQELFHYVSEQLANGFAKEQIRQAVVDAGWSAADISEAFEALEKPTVKPIENPAVATMVQPEPQAPQAAPIQKQSLAGNPPIVSPLAPAQPVVASSVQPQITQPAANQPKVKKEHHALKGIIYAILVIIVLIVAVGVGAFGAHFYITNFAK